MSNDGAVAFLWTRDEIEKISGVTLRVLNMKASVRFYGDVLGMEIVYGGKPGEGA